MNPGGCHALASFLCPAAANRWQCNLAGGALALCLLRSFFAHSYCTVNYMSTLGGVTVFSAKAVLEGFDGIIYGIITRSAPYSICCLFFLTRPSVGCVSDKTVSLPHRAMKIEKKTVAGLSNRWLARAVPHADTSFQ